MTNEMNFSEEELESMADKLLEEASVTDISAQPELELPKPKRKSAAKKKDAPEEPRKSPEETLQDLLEKGKKAGRLSAKELAVLEDLNLDGEVVSKFYETLEQNNVDIDVGGEDVLPPIDDVLPEVEDLADIEEVPEEEITDTDALIDTFATDDPVRMYLKEIGKVPLLTEEQARIVDELIRQLGAESTPQLRVYNKCDAYFGILPHGEDVVCISAKSGEGADVLVQKLSQMLDRGKRHVQLLLPYSAAGLLDTLKREAAVQYLEYRDDGIELEAVVQPELFGRVKRYIPGYAETKEDWEE